MKRELCPSARRYSRFTHEHARFSICPERLTRNSIEIIPPHRLDGNLAPKEINPTIRKFFALLRLDGLDGAGIALEKNARMIFARFQSKSASVFAQVRVSLNKILITQAQEGREIAYFVDQSSALHPASGNKRRNVDNGGRFPSSEMTLTATVFSRAIDRLPAHCGVDRSSPLFLSIFSVSCVWTYIHLANRGVGINSACARKPPNADKLEDFSL